MSSIRSERNAQDDYTLLQRVQQDDENALMLLYDRYASVVYSVALRVIHDPVGAEDILQEIFTRIWRSPEHFVVSQSGLARWLVVASRNRAIDLLRTSCPRDAVEDLLLASPYELGRDTEPPLMYEKARALIDSLPVEQREVLEMSFYIGMTLSEIAAATRCSEGKVKTRIRNALMTLREAFRLRPPV